MQDDTRELYIMWQRSKQFSAENSFEDRLPQSIIPVSDYQICVIPQGDVVFEVYFTASWA
jgi:hypothetical protein